MATPKPQHLTSQGSICPWVGHTPPLISYNSKTMTSSSKTGLTCRSKDVSWPNSVSVIAEPISSISLVSSCIKNKRKSGTIPPTRYDKPSALTFPKYSFGHIPKSCGMVISTFLSRSNQPSLMKTSSLVLVPLRLNSLTAKMARRLDLLCAIRVLPKTRPKNWFV